MPLSQHCRILAALLYCLLVVTLSCKKAGEPNVALSNGFQSVDSLLNAGKAEQAIQLLKELRPQIDKNNPLLSAYYCHLAEYYILDTAKAVLYADSAVTFFADDDKRNENPEEYLRALLIKGDVCFMVKEYSMALEHFEMARKLLGNKDRDGKLASKMALIYFGQGNFEVAARYWVESYGQLVRSHAKYSPQQLFYLKQATLDNAGIAYERMNMLDSAVHYYKIDLQVLNNADKDNRVRKESVHQSRIVLYDNLGGAYLKMNNLDSAAHYLLACVALPTVDIDGMRISSFLKLAQLHVLRNEDKAAAAAFEKSRLLLKRYGKENTRAKMFWYKEYAAFMQRQNKPYEAYEYQNEYIRIKDSIEGSFAKLRRIDIEQELNAIHQKNRVTQLEQQSRLEKLYVKLISVAIVIAMVVIVLIIRILRQSRKNHKEAQKRNKSLKITMDELENANKNVTRIMRVMAHDLRTPLSGIIGLSTVIKEEDALPPDSKHMVQIIEDTGTRTLDMIDELLKTGLSDEKEVEKKPVDLNALLEDLVELLQFKADEKQLTINFYSEGAVVVQLSYEKMWRVFSNIIANAIKFSHRGDTITVSLGKTPDNEAVLVAIADNGIGIPEKEHKEVFEMFTEAKRLGTDGEKSFGLGLAISKRIVTLHNGKLWFESQPQKGTTFYVELPA